MSKKNENHAPPSSEHSEPEAYGVHNNYGNYGGYGGYGNYGGYGHGNYGGYGKGASYGGYGKEDYHGYGEAEGATAAHSLRDYLLMIRERWLILFFFVLTGCLCGVIYIANRTPEYMASSKLRLFRRSYSTAALTGGSVNIDSEGIGSQEDLNTQVSIMKGSSVVRRVLKNMDTELRDAVLKPYQAGNVFSGPLTAEEVATACRAIVPERGSLMVEVTYFHPDPVIAIQMANLFAKEIGEEADESRLKLTGKSLDHSATELDNAERQMSDLHRRRNEILSQYPQLLVRDELTGRQALLLTEAEAKVRLRESEHGERKEVLARIEEIKRTKQTEGLKESFREIAQVSDVLYSAGQVNTLKADIAALLERYTEEHASVKAMRRRLQSQEAALERAVLDAESRLKEELTLAEGRVELAKKERDKVIEDGEKLQKAQYEYTEVRRLIEEKEVQRRAMRTAFEAERLRHTGAQLLNIAVQEEARLVQMKAINKDYWKGGGLGLLAGVALGLALVFALATLDDRVKSVDDIERFLRLQLIGILPTVRRRDAYAKAKLISTGKDIATTEAFRSLFSALKINETAKRARVLLTTSTSPSEGKSFVTTNLAMMYARQGERVLVVDADLRMPVVAETLQLNETQGILPHLRGTCTLEKAIHYEFVKNLDILPAGKIRRGEDPMRWLNSPEFAEMLLTLRSCYDRILVDSPPIGAVSDVLNLIPKVDGILYVIRFNSVRKRFIAASLNRLRETKIPIFGGVLNQIGMSSVRYYTNADDRAYGRYYSEPGSKRKKRKPAPANKKSDASKPKQKAADTVLVKKKK
ncbi:MAG: polysaccharide biosynthesis tyrosine autokinase [Puniceicoccales bacterium]|jgi:capsular exopolysaccharide synthesis family protein|nr:polysaccharide biosynthesis tyrosine autokinase [Puniceicoccales bacterium]